MGDPGLIPSTPIWRFTAVCNSSSSTLFQLPCRLHMCEKYTHAHLKENLQSKVERDRGMRKAPHFNLWPPYACACTHTTTLQAHVQTHKNMRTVCSGLNTTDQTPTAAHNSGRAGLGLCFSLHTCLPPGPLSNCRCKFASRLAQHPQRPH